MPVLFDQLEITASSDDGTTCMANLDSTDLFEVNTAAVIKTDAELSKDSEPPSVISFPFGGSIYVIVDTCLYGIRIEETITSNTQLVLPDAVSDHYLCSAYVLLVLKNGMIMILDENGFSETRYQLPYHEGATYSIGVCEATVEDTYVVVLVGYANNTTELIVFEVDEAGGVPLIDGLRRIASYPGLPAGFLAVTSSGISVIPKSRSDHRLFIDSINLLCVSPLLETLAINFRMPVDEVRTFEELVLVRCDGFVYAYTNLSNITPDGEIDFYSLKADILQFQVLNHEGSFIKSTDKLVIQVKEGDDYKLYYTNMNGDFGYTVDVPRTVSICSKLTIPTDYADNVAFVEGFSMKNPRGVRVRLIYESRPEIRLRNLLDKERFDAAMKWAKDYNLDTSIVLVSQVQHMIRIINQFGTEEQNIDEFLSLLGQLPDEQSFDYAFEVMMLARTYENIEKMLNFCHGRQVKDESLVNNVQSFKYAVTSYGLVYGPNADFTNPIWEVFPSKEHHWELFLQLIEDAKIDRARCLWERYIDVMEKTLQNRLEEFRGLVKLFDKVIRTDLNLVNDVINLLEHDILPSFVSMDNLPALSQYSECLIEFFKTMVSLLEISSKDYPYNAHFVVDTVRRFTNRILQKIGAYDQQEALVIQLSDIAIGLQTKNCFTDLAILSDQLKMMCHIKRKYDVECSISDVANPSFDKLALKMLSNFTYGVGDNLRAYAQTKIIPFCVEFHLSKDEIFLKFIKSCPGDLQACLVLSDMIDENDLCARTTMTMMKNCPVTKAGWPPVLQTQIEKILNRDISSSIRNGVKALILRRDIAVILAAYPRILPKNLISDIPNDRNLSLLCTNVLFSSHSTTSNKLADVKRLYKISQSDPQLRFDFTVFCHDVMSSLLSDVEVDYAFLDDFLKGLENYAMKKQIVLSCINSHLDVMGRLPAELLSDYMKHLRALRSHLKPGSPEELKVDEQMTVICNAYTAFGLQITPKKIGNFQEMKLDLIAALQNPDNDLTFSGYQKFGEMLLLDMNQVMGLLWNAKIVEKMLESEELKLRLQNMLSDLFNTKFVATYQPEALITTIYVYLSLFGQRLLNVSDLGLLGQNIGNIIKFVQVQVIDPSDQLSEMWSTLLSYLCFVNSVINAIIPEEPLNSLEKNIGDVENMEYERASDCVFEREYALDTKVLQTVFKLAITVNNDALENTRKELWTEILMSLSSTCAFKLCFEAFELIQTPNFLVDPSSIFPLYNNILGAYVEKLIVHYGKEFLGCDAAICAINSSPELEGVKNIIELLFRSFYQKQQRFPAFRCLELQMKLGFSNHADALKRMNAVVMLDQLATVDVNLSSRYMAGGPLPVMDTLVQAMVPPKILIDWCERFGHSVENALQQYLFKLIEVQLPEEKQPTRTVIVAQTFDVLGSLEDQTKLVKNILDSMLRNVNPYDYDLIETLLAKCIAISSDESITKQLTRYFTFIKFLRSEGRIKLIDSVELDWLKERALDGLQESEWAQARLPFHIFIGPLTQTLRDFLLYELSTERLDRWKEVLHNCSPLLQLNINTLESSAILNDLERCCHWGEMNASVMARVKQLLILTPNPDSYLKKISCQMNTLPNSLVRTELLRSIYSSMSEVFLAKKTQHDSKIEDFKNALSLIRIVKCSGEMHTFLKKFNFISERTLPLITNAKVACSVVIDEFTDWDSWNQIYKTLNFLSEVSAQRLISLRQFLREYLDGRLSGQSEMNSDPKNDVVMNDLDLTVSMVPMETSSEVSGQYGIPYMDRDVTKMAMIMAMAYNEEEVIEFVEKNVPRANDEVKWLCVVLRAAMILKVNIKDKIAPRLGTAMKEELLRNSRERTNLAQFEDTGKDLLIRSQICTTNIHTSFKHMDTDGQLRLCSSIALGLIKQGKIEFAHVAQLIERLLAQKMNDVAFTLLKTFNSLQEPIRNHAIASLYAAIFAQTVNSSTKLEVEERVAAMLRCPEDCQHIYQSAVSVLRKMGMDHEANQLEAASGQVHSTV